jgi:hypothetical protein
VDISFIESSPCDAGGCSLATEPFARTSGRILPLTAVAAFGNAHFCRLAAIFGSRFVAPRLMSGM